MRTISEILAFELGAIIEEDWDHYMTEGYTIAEGSTYILNQYKELVDDEGEQLIYVTLGLIQLELESVDPRVKEVIHEIIEEEKLTDYLNDHIDNKRLIKQIKKRYK